MSFIAALLSARQALRDAGYPGATVAVLLSPADVIPAQREFQLAERMVEQAIHPAPGAPVLGVRLLAVVQDVHVYVRES